MKENENTFHNVVWGMVAISFRPQCVNPAIIDLKLYASQGINKVSIR